MQYSATSWSLSRRSFVAASALAASTAATCGLSACGQNANDAEDAREGGEVGEPLDQKVGRLLSSLSREQKVAQLFVVHPEALTGVGTQTSAGDATREALGAHPVGGLILSASNIVDPAQTEELVARLKSLGREAAAGLAPLVAVDEEGGTVSRVASNPAFDIANVGNMSDVGQTRDPARARDAAATIAAYLGGYGFGVDFAPVCDVVSDPANSSMALRSFGSDPDVVSAMASAQIEAFCEGGICCCAKHFPGIGNAQGDSHEQMISLGKDLDELKALELRPFAAAIESDVPMVMVGHLSCPAVVGGKTPASLSSVMVQGLLRSQMGYEGVVITDSLDMGAVATWVRKDCQGVAALAAGCDLILTPVDFDEAYRGVLDALDSGELSQERLDESVRRIIALKLRFSLVSEDA